MKGLGLVSMATGRKRWVINPLPPSCSEGGGCGSQEVGLALGRRVWTPFLCGAVEDIEGFGGRLRAWVVGDLV